MEKKNAIFMDTRCLTLLNVGVQHEKLKFEQVNITHKTWQVFVVIT